MIRTGRQAELKVQEFWCRCAYGTHPFPSRTRWLRHKRPMVLCWRRHGRAGGCHIIWIIVQWSEYINNSIVCESSGSIPLESTRQQISSEDDCWQYVPWKLHIEIYDMYWMYLIRKLHSRWLVTAFTLNSWKTSLSVQCNDINRKIFCNNIERWNQTNPLL